jgi:hypothetical protein
MTLAAKANSFSSTASGIMAEAKHSKVIVSHLLPLPLSPLARL